MNYPYLGWHPLRTSALLLALLALCLPSAAAGNNHLSPIYIKHLNFDCWPDTVYARHAGLAARPSHIAWGRRPRGLSPCEKGKSPLIPKYPAARRKLRTELSFPEWQGFQVKTAVLNINPALDTLSDLVLIYWGRARNSKGRMQDTSRMLCIPGQNGLDTIARFDFKELGPGLQTAPFFAVELSRGSSIVQPKRRSMGGDTSFVVLDLDVDVLRRRAEREEPPPVFAAEVRVFPNPVINLVRVEARAVPSGSYTVELVAVNGLVLQSHSARSNDDGHLLHLLKLDQVTTGYYVVRIRSAGALIGQYPIAIVK